jgi:RNA polymerase sigma-70 factor (ECF subfamily)
LIEIENPNNILEAKELENIIGKAIDSLPERCYAVFSLKRFGALKNKEIASKLNISEKTVENYTTLAFSKIRETIKKHFTDSIIAFVIFLYFLIGG